MTQALNNILALDIGDKRVGVAVASLAARLPHPLTTLKRGESFLNELKKVVEIEKADAVVVGLPRGLDGQETSQTRTTEQLIGELRRQLDIQIYTQDEALTSKQAEAELRSRGSTYVKGEIDALAATYILEDFLNGYNSTK